MSVRPRRRHSWWSAFGAVAAATALPCASPVTMATAQQAVQTNASPLPVWLSIVQSDGRILTLDRPAGTVLVADPTIADVQVVSEFVVFVWGIKTGRTRLVLLDMNESLIASIPLSVTPSLASLFTRP